MESSAQIPDGEPSSESEPPEAAENESVITISQIKVWLHVASRRARKTGNIEQALKHLVEVELEETEIEVHWLEVQTTKSHCSRVHRHSDTYLTFEGACTSEMVEQLLVELDSIAYSLRVAERSIKATKATRSEP